MKWELSTETTTLLVVMVTSFLTPFMGSAINLAIPSIGAQFGTDAVFLGWIVNAYLLSSAALLLPFGRLADIVGKRKIFIAGTLLFSVFTFLSGMAWSATALLVFRVCQGLASSMVYSTGMAIITLTYPAAKRGRAMGFTVSAVYLGLSLGPVLGGMLNHYLGWQSIFFATALLGVFALLLTLWRLKTEWWGAKGEPFDYIGSITYVAAITALLYGFSTIAKTAEAKYIFIGGLLLFGAFLYYEMRQPYPILRVSLFRQNPVFAFSNVAAMINYSATFAIGFLLSLHLQVVLGYDSQTAGFILLSQPVIMAVVSPFSGIVSDRVEPRIVASAGMGLCTLGLVVFSFLSAQTPLVYIVGNLAMIGLGFALFASPNNSAIMGAVDKKHSGVAASVLSTMRMTGQSVSMAIVTLLLSIHAGNVGINREHANLVVQSSHAAFGIFAVLCAFGIFASLARGRITRGERG